MAEEQVSGGWEGHTGVGSSIDPQAPGEEELLLSPRARTTHRTLSRSFLPHLRAGSLLEDATAQWCQPVPVPGSPRRAGAEPGANMTPSIPSLPQNSPHPHRGGSTGPSSAPAPRWYPRCYSLACLPGVAKATAETQQTATTHSRQSANIPLLFSPRFGLCFFPFSHEEAAAIGRERRYYSLSAPSPRAIPAGAASPSCRRCRQSGCLLGRSPTNPRRTPSPARGGSSPSPTSWLPPERSSCAEEPGLRRSQVGRVR